MTTEESRKETTHIDEVRRSAAASVQWLVEPHSDGEIKHPITHNNKLKLFICGKEGFQDIAAEIGFAERSIDLCCWGFDPGMELQRMWSSQWPRGVTFGDLLLNAAKRGVKVRLLVWQDWIGSKLVHNMPGYTHNTHPWYKLENEKEAQLISAEHSVRMLTEFNNKARNSIIKPFVRSQKEFPIAEEDIPLMARMEYCYSWYQAVANGYIPEIKLLTRSGKPSHIKRSLSDERVKPAGFSTLELEEAGFLHLGTHHQKTILIDYCHANGNKAVGYVMGLNSVTDYWDTVEHKLEDPLREAGGEAELKESLQKNATDSGFRTLKPYQDYACRIEAGKALVDVNENFQRAWLRAVQASERVQEKRYPNTVSDDIPIALTRKAESGDSTAQIVRTQPEESDKTIQDAYWQATATAATTAGYIYIENQYFQCEHWAQHLLKCRKETISRWRQASQNARKKREDLPILYLFVVTPVPEREQMIPRTYDTLATFGEHRGMTGQEDLIDKQNKQGPRTVRSGFGTTAQIHVDVPPVIKHANSIDKPDKQRLEEEYGIKVCVAMLNTCEFEGGRWRYREIYIHSKLMIANDIFFTLGSANANQRSFAVDSEINIAVQDPEHATELRRKVWILMSGGVVDGGDGSKRELKKAFNQWADLITSNMFKRIGNGQSAVDKKLKGFILPLEDKRSSLIRLG